MVHDRDMKELLQFIPENGGAEVNIVTHAYQALQALDYSSPDIFISDICLPD